LPLRCPKCPEVTKPTALTEHLWNEHRLVLDGVKYWEPWALVRELLGRYIARNDPLHLERALAIATRADPDRGWEQFARMALSQRIKCTFVEDVIAKLPPMVAE